MPELNLQKAFETAMQQHDAGNLRAAEAVYRQILQIYPDHPDVLHRLGIMASQLGNNELAVQYIRHALKIFPDAAEYIGNLGMVLCNMGQVDEGMKLYYRALELKPDYPECLSNLGNQLRALGRPAEAVEQCRRAVQIRPNFAVGYNNLGNALLDLKRTDEAIAAYKTTLELNPNFPEGLNNIGGALQEMKRFEEAVPYYRRALEINPQYADALNNLGNAVGQLGDKKQAIELCRKALQIRPNFVEALNTLTHNLTEAGQQEEALITGRKTIALRPEYPEAHNNVGNALYELDRIDEAMDSYRHALSLRTNYFEAKNNLGNALHVAGRLAEAEVVCRDALKMNSDFAAAHWNLALILLVRGKFDEAWEEYEYRWSVKELRPPKVNLPGARWKGEDLHGKRLLLYVEQGFGDTIQFVRFFPMLVERGAKVILLCQPELIRVLKNVPGLDQIFPMEERRPKTEFDYHFPLLSVPRMLNIRADQLSYGVPYIRPDETDVAKWRDRVPKDGRLKVGLAWAGRPTHANDKKRSTTLSTFAPLVEAGNAWFCSLQKGERAIEADNPPKGMELVDWTTELRDFADTAALIANLDLVIAVDTSVVHLAGAMGKPVWVMIPQMNDWRWQRDRSDSPWYPSLRLFRQPKLWDYQTPIHEIVQALKSLIQEKP